MIKGDCVRLFFKKIALCLAASILFSSCISKMIDKAIPQQAKNEEKVQSVKSLAIVAFDVLAFVPTGVGGKVVGGVSTVQFAANTVAEETELAKNLYAYLEKQLKSKGIKVISLEQITSNSVYQKLYKLKKGSLAEKQANHFQKPNSIKNLLRDANPTYLFTAEERAQLAKALNIDSLVMARVSYNVVQNDYLGLGIANSYLKPNITYHMYNKTDSDPIWFNNSFAGPQSEESLGKVSGLEDVQLIAKLSQPLAEKTIDNFLNNNNKK